MYVQHEIMVIYAALAKSYAGGNGRIGPILYLKNGRANGRTGPGCRCWWAVPRRRPANWACPSVSKCTQGRWQQECPPVAAAQADGIGNGEGRDRWRRRGRVVPRQDDAIWVTSGLRNNVWQTLEVEEGMHVHSVYVRDDAFTA